MSAKERLEKRIKKLEKLEKRIRTLEAALFIKNYKYIPSINPWEEHDVTDRFHALENHLGIELNLDSVDPIHYKKIIKKK